MTRKKFIKMLMYAGMPRNDAADCATLAQDAGRPYFKVLGDLLNFHRPQFKYMTLAWIKIRYAIIYGHDSPVYRFFGDIDEVNTWPLPAGSLEKVPAPNIVVHTNVPAPGPVAIRFNRLGGGGA